MKDSGSNWERVKALTQDQRDAALHAARTRIAELVRKSEGGDAIGSEPLPQDFEHVTFTRFPPAFMRAINVLCVCMLLAAFLPSAIRLHKEGLATFSESVTHVQSQYVAALCIVLMAETGQIIFSLAAATQAGASKRTWRNLINARALFTLGALICTAIALSGNAKAVGEHAYQSVFAFLETYAPPLLVLLTAQVLKSQLLHAIENRHAAQQAYTAARAAWRSASAAAELAYHNAYNDAHQHADWRKVYANALRDALRRANRNTLAVNALSNDEWRNLILREQRMDAWYEEAEAAATAQAQAEAETRDREEQLRASTVVVRALAERTGSTHGSHTGEFDNAVTQNADGTFTGTCPHCGYVVTNKPTMRAAKASLVAHSRGCVARKVVMQSNGTHALVEA